MTQTTTLPCGDPFHLANFDPSFSGDMERKRQAKAETKDNMQALFELQARLYAENRRSLLVVLQAMDAAGKDGTIKHVMGAFNPQGVRVTSFKAPSKLELAHDFLWRVHGAAPRRGMIGIFNRSHYEDVLIVRVLKLAPEEVWRARFDHINAFEKLLTDNATTIVKIFLHINPEEQAERLRARLDTPGKEWKFNIGDLDARQRWGDYMAAYEEAMTRCNTPHAPWHVVPANRKWYRNLAVSRIVRRTLEGLNPTYPDPEPGLDEVDIPPVRWP